MKQVGGTMPKEKITADRGITFSMKDDWSAFYRENAARTTRAFS